MGDSDNKDTFSGLGDLDWDSALDEWEKNTFVPELARDAETNRVANPLGKDEPAEKPPTVRPAAGVPADPTGDPGRLKDLGTEGTGTLIAPVPRELSDPPPPMPATSPPGAPSDPPAPGTPPSTPSGGRLGVATASLPPSTTPRPGSVLPPPPAQRGGLGQLFSRRESVRPPPVAPPPPRAPSEKTRVAPPASDLLGEKSPSVTRQLAAKPSSGEIGPESSPTIVRSSDPPPDALADLERTQERPASGNLVGPPSQNVGDAPTISTRDVAAAAMENALAELAPALPKPAPVKPPPARKPPKPIDDDDEKDVATVIADRKKLESISDADTATRHPAEDEEPTIGRPSAAPMATSQPVPSALFEGIQPSIAPHTERERPPAPEGPVTFEGERPVSRWLDEKTTTAYRARAVWLEEEARSLEDPLAQARALLAVSEILALIGEEGAALNLALEARDLAPQLPLAWRQARQLMPRDPDALAEALDAEAARSPTPSARAHATLLAADLLRLTERGDAAVERWDSACKLDPADVRAPIARAALALAQNDHTSGALLLAENSDLVEVDKAVATALRLRGVERPGAEVEDLPINEGLRRARNALIASDAVTTAQALTEVAKVSELSKAALWLSASFGATHIAARRGAAKSLKTLAADGESLAKRQLAARGIELGDPDLVNVALEGDGPFDAAERATLAALASQDVARTLEALVDRDELASLHDALAAISSEDPPARARRVAGTKNARALGTLGRLLAARVGDKEIDEALRALPAPTEDEKRAPSATGVAIEAAVRGRRFGELAEALAGLETGDDAAAATQKNVAAAIVAERAGNAELARSAWKEAVAAGATHDGVLRIAAKLDPDVDLVAELLRAADDMPDGIPASLLRLEALARSTLSDDEQASVLDKVHRGAPALGIGSFLAERIARRKGDLDEVLRWIQERRSYATDPLESALDSVREALLVADRDPELASTRLEEAHRARPDDVALRELYERLASEPPADRGTWREKRAESVSDQAKAAMLVEAALEHERAGDDAAALRTARAAVEAGDRGIAPLVQERAELATGDVTRQTEQLLAIVKTTEDPVVRREAHERLADLDAYGKKDRTAALAWHRLILDDVEGDPKPHKPSLRFVEHTLITEGRDDDLEPLFEQIALALDGTAGGEVTGHAQHAARFLMRSGAGWDKTRNMAVLAATQPEPSLWALRALNAHARVMKDEEAILKTTIALLERTQRPSERAALLLRASESAARLEQVADARAFLEQAASEDPGDVVTWGFLAEVRERAGETRSAAEACESLARTSAVREHQLLAFHDAAKIWLDEVKDTERAMAALEAAAEIDPNYADVFKRLSALYTEKGLDAELARLLERRLETMEDPEERVALEVDLARTQAEMGDLAKAKTALESALKKRPDHTTALSAMADVCAKEGDWTGAEHAYVRLARLLTTPEEQKEVYEKLAEIYAVHLQNLSRAEVAYKEVLKRGTNDKKTTGKLVDVYKRQGDIARAVEMQQQLISAATDPNERLERLIELASIHETVGRDPRRSEQVLDSARKEYPTSVVALRAMAEFYSRQRQAPAMQILLDRAAGDARRAFAQGRFVPSLFEVLHAAFELRGKKDAARVVAATLAAVEGQKSELGGAEARAIDPRLDDVLAPEIMSPALRALLFRAGDALDAVSPVDLRALRAEPLRPGTPIGATVGSIATVIGLGAMQILVSPQLGRVAVPLLSAPATLLVGEKLMQVPNERARVFIVVRALKAILTRSSALFRAAPADAAVLANALFTAFNPSFVPQNVDARRVSELARRIVPALPRNLDPTVGVIALEAAGMLGGQGSQLAQAAVAWANRAALLSVGDPSAALDGIAWAMNEEAAPKGSEERAAWVARHQEARDLMTYSVTDQYAEARSRLGLDK